MKNANRRAVWPTILLTFCLVWARKTGPAVTNAWSKYIHGEYPLSCKQFISTLSYLLMIQSKINNLLFKAESWARYPVRLEMWRFSLPSICNVTQRKIWIVLELQPHALLVTQTVAKNGTQEYEPSSPNSTIVNAKYWCMYGHINA